MTWDGESAIHCAERYLHTLCGPPEIAYCCSAKNTKWQLESHSTCEMVPGIKLLALCLKAGALSLGFHFLFLYPKTSHLMLYLEMKEERSGNNPGVQ